MLLSSVAKETRIECPWLSALSWTGLFVCCVALVGPEGWGFLASQLLSPVGFDSFDITHQVLREADTKNLKRTRKT